MTDSPVYVYAFCRPLSASLQLPVGIAGPLTLLQDDYLAAITEPGLAFDTITTSDNSLMQAVLVHDRVLCDLFQHLTLLPLRFGTRFLSAHHVLLHLAERRTAYLEQLQLLEGKAEYTLKLIPQEQDPSEPPDTSLRGRDYFLAKKQRYQTQAQTQQQQQQERDALMRLIQQQCPAVVPGENQDGAERLFILWEATADLTTQVKLWQQHCRHWLLNLSEPLPPYHFVGQA